jgi:hypothetical protein
MSQICYPKTGPSIKDVLEDDVVNRLAEICQKANLAQIREISVWLDELELDLKELEERK